MGNDGLTTVVINQSELGQGITTALSMCVADELDIPMSSVRFRMAPAEPKYYNPRLERMRHRRQQEHADDVAGDAQSRCDRARDAGDRGRNEMERRSRDVHDVERRRVRAGRTKGEVRRRS